MSLQTNGEPARKKRRGSKKAASKSSSAQMMPPDFLNDVEVIVSTDDGSPTTLVDSSGNMAEIAQEADGSVTVDFEPVQPTKSKNFDDNLAESIPDGVLRGIANDLIDAIEEDERDRSEWLTQRAEGMDLLALKVEKPGMGNAGTSSTSVPGQSTVRDSILLEAVLRFQANSYAELCPSGGPCKGVNFGDETASADQLAEELEKDFNYYLTTTAREYQPDTRRMLFWTGYASGMFKKVYKCPLRRRPVSESVDGADLIIPSNVSDLHNAGRITHQIDMRQAVMRRMQILGVYRDVPLSTPTPEPNALTMKEASISGLAAKPQRDEDQTYTVYECYCELDIPGFEHKDDGAPSGLPLPYRVTMDKDSRTILEIRRNWREDDPDQRAKIPFVAFPYASGISIYGSGLLHILGNVTMALTALTREAIDAGMYANFPGGIIAAGATRQKNNEIRVAPGALAPIDIPANMRIQDAIMPLPYKDVTPGLMTLMTALRDVGNRVGGSAEVPVGEGVQNAPVGTTLAMIEQATKIEGGVHKALHAAQAEEFQLLKELFKDDPESLWQGNRRPAMGKDLATRVAKFRRALEDCEIIPASDPNVPSHIHRLAKASALKQLTAGNSAYDPVAVDRRVAAMMKIDDFDALLAPPAVGPPQVDPVIQAQLQLEGRKVGVMEAKAQIDAQKVQLSAANAEQDRQLKGNIESMKIASQYAANQQQTPEMPEPDGITSLDAVKLRIDAAKVAQKDKEIAFKAANAHLDRQSKETLEAMKIAQAIAVHPGSNEIVDEQLLQMGEFLKPTQGRKDGGKAPPMSGGGRVGYATGGSPGWTGQSFSASGTQMAPGQFANGSSMWSSAPFSQLGTGTSFGQTANGMGNVFGGTPFGGMSGSRPTMPPIQQMTMPPMQQMAPSQAATASGVQPFGSNAPSRTPTLPMPTEAFGGPATNMMSRPAELYGQDMQPLTNMPRPTESYGQGQTVPGQGSVGSLPLPGIATTPGDLGMPAGGHIAAGQQMLPSPVETSPPVSAQMPRQSTVFGSSQPSQAVGQGQSTSTIPFGAMPIPRSAMPTEAYSSKPVAQTLPRPTEIYNAAGGLNATSVPQQGQISNNAPNMMDNVNAGGYAHGGVTRDADNDQTIRRALEIARSMLARHERTPDDYLQ